ncbi:PTS sugar transporter subunit IIA [Halobacillus litoralis]|uniref:PTS sugar transporter subunit IIA n=1 Tax=Halobacillus litoralis TaxID=45668 RepID=UPI001CFED02B|nr:PTS sugar transporter subunit IIA [Halobacillus litoralis]WLR46620.1 PTS sugar transporter subunit IIA [Halobacillus litoralis]
MSNLLDRNLIFLHSSPSNFTEALTEIGNVMIAKGYANNDYVEGLLKREEEFATGIPVEAAGVAIPHTDASFVKDNKIGLMIPKHPINFGIMGGDGEEVAVQLIILLGFADSQNHLSALQKVIESIQDPSFIEKLVSVESADEAYSCLEEYLTINLEEEIK